MKYKPSLLYWLEQMFKHSEEKKWYETYHAFDIHGVISKPDYRKSGEEFTINYYPYAKETLQFLTKNRPDMILFIMTSSYPKEIDSYMKQFQEDNIFFKYVNENPEITDLKGNFGCYDKKPYFNSYWEDKAGFRPEIDWQPIYEYFVNSDYKPDPSWSFKTIESYHKKEYPKIDGTISSNVGGNCEICNEMKYVFNVVKLDSSAKLKKMCTDCFNKL